MLVCELTARGISVSRGILCAGREAKNQISWKENQQLKYILLIKEESKDTLATRGLFRSSYFAMPLGL